MKMRAIFYMFCGFLVALFVITGAKVVRAETNDGSWWQNPIIQGCCSEADALYADEWEMLPNGDARVRVTGGGPRNHAWAERFMGQEFIIPKDKVKVIEGNFKDRPGRPILFMNSGGYIYCFIAGAMI